MKGDPEIYAANGYLPYCGALVETVVEYWFDETRINQYPDANPIDPRDESPNPHRELVYTTSSIESGDTTLPIHKYNREIVEAVANHPVTLIKSGTGTGKTSQVAQILANRFPNKKINLLLPRRIAAKNAYEKIHSDISDAHGHHVADQLVNYRTARESDGAEDARISIVTEGLHLVEGIRDSEPDEEFVVILDEAHEATRISTFTALLSRAKLERPDINIKLVIMSADIDTKLYGNYFRDATGTDPAVIELSGRKNNVTTIELPNSDPEELAVQSVLEILDLPEEERQKGNGILVFLPGVNEIRETEAKLRKLIPYDARGRSAILQLYSQLARSEKELCMDRKLADARIVLSTNVAETSLTIPGIRVVIDTSTKRIERLDENGHVESVIVTISAAETNQRGGRAGREDISGIHYCTSLPGHPYVPIANRQRYMTPEIAHTDLTRDMLRLARMGLYLPDKPLIFEPGELTLTRAKQKLINFGAFDQDGKITPIGIEMDKYPLAIGLTRMMVEAERLNDETLALMAAAVSIKEAKGLLRQNPGDEWKSFVETTSSDMIALVELYIAAQPMTPQELRQAGLDEEKLKEARIIYGKIAKIAGVSNETLHYPDEKQVSQLRKCIITGLPEVYIGIGPNEFRRAAGSDVVRGLGRNSIVNPNSHLVVGWPFRVETIRNGNRQSVSFLNTVTAVTPEEIGEALRHMTGESQAGFSKRNGNYYRKTVRMFGGIAVGQEIETPAEPSRSLSEQIIEDALRSPSNTLRQFSGLKKELRQLQHKTLSHVPQITNDTFMDILRQATEGATSLPLFNHRLRTIIYKDKLTKRDLLDEETEARIIQNAPDQIKVCGVDLMIRYRHGVPYVKHYPSEEALLQIDQDIFLPDGRQVFFKVNKRRVTIIRKQEEILDTKAHAKYI